MIPGTSKSKNSPRDLTVNMLRTIHIEGFKSIASEALDLGRVNCFIGANGVGKSNVLEAIGILGAAAAGRVDDESLLHRGVRAGTPTLYKAAFTGARVPPHIMLNAESEAGAGYRVALLNPLNDPQPAWSFKTENLYAGQSGNLVTRGVKSVNLEPTAGLAALRLVDIPAGSPPAKLMSGLKNYAIYCPNTPVLRGLEPDSQARAPVGLCGGRLAEAVQELKRQLDKDSSDDSRADVQAGLDENLFESVIELLDWVDDLDTTDAPGALLSSSVPRGRLVLRFRDRFMSQSRNQLTAYDASEGALYVLFTAVLCLSDAAPQILAIDNLDQALNPRLATRLTASLSHWLERSNPHRQLLFTAHNPAVLDGLDLADDGVRLFAVERTTQGQTRCRRIRPTQELLEQNRQYPLSRLWLRGDLGAVPNV